MCIKLVDFTISRGATVTELPNLRHGHGPGEVTVTMGQPGVRHLIHEKCILVFTVDMFESLRDQSCSSRLPIIIFLQCARSLPRRLCLPAPPRYPSPFSPPLLARDSSHLFDTAIGST